MYETQAKRWVLACSAGAVCYYGRRNLHHISSYFLLKRGDILFSVINQISLHIFYYLTEGSNIVNRRLFRKLELWGGLVVFAIAAFLHFFYDLTGGSVLGTLLGSVNESVWEHMKIFSIAYIIYAVLEYLWARPPFRAFVVAKTIGMYFLAIGIAVFYYTYTFFTGEPVLAVDLISGLVFSFIAHLVSLRIVSGTHNTARYYQTAVILFLLAFAMILCFSYFPPKSELFRDVVTGTYGAIPSVPDEGAVFLDGHHHSS